MQLNNLIATRPRKKVYRDGDLAIKIFEQGYPKSDILNEALNQARCEDTGLLIPKVQGVTVIGGQWAIVMDFVEGPTLASLIKSPSDPAMGDFVDQHLLVHSKKAPLLNVLKHKITRQLSSYDLDERARFELLTRLESLPKHYKLCHGDFIPSNIVINAKDNLPYILDWSHATQGNASADVARTYLWLKLNDQLGMADSYLDLYCQKSGVKKSYVQGWMPIVAAAQLSKGIPEEKDFLSGWINVFDYE
ncbi:MAG: aminoglycoside phosphotransferase family protein [Deltaproteobacteria bacterium]|jgi:tRNA A-37 threonylcarbamoyl transferase component Bud32|nr:aminoglycoside phosphotransferase family protein [Deltaproteobacteria bacterium]